MMYLVLSVETNEVLLNIFFFFSFFLRCEHVKRFWDQLETVVNNACANGLFVNRNESIVLFGHDCSFKSDDTFDPIILLATFFIYKCKVKKNIPQFHLFINYLKAAFEACKYIAIINMSYDKFTIGVTVLQDLDGIIDLQWRM